MTKIRSKIQFNPQRLEDARKASGKNVVIAASQKKSMSMKERFAKVARID